MSPSSHLLGSVFLSMSPSHRLLCVFVVYESVYCAVVVVYESGYTSIVPWLLSMSPSIRLL